MLPLIYTVLLKISGSFVLHLDLVDDDSTSYEDAESVRRCVGHVPQARAH